MSATTLAEHPTRSPQPGALAGRPPAIVAAGLRKSYGDVHAVDGVDLEVAQGEIFALLGPNGAGKTTTIEMLEGFRTPDGGHAEVLGFDPGNRRTSTALRERLGVVLQEAAIEPFLSVRHVLDRQAGYFRSPQPVGELAELVGLREKLNAKVKTLSGGQLRKLDLALGIIGRPDLLILDEPTTGLDPSARRETWTLIRRLADAGATVLLTTHYMEEAEVLASRVAIMSGGRIVAQGTPAALRRDLKETCRIRFELPPDVVAPHLPITAEHVGDAFEIRTSDEIRVLAELTHWALEREIEVIGLTVERMSLEDVYLQFVSQTTADEEERR